MRRSGLSRFASDRTPLLAAHPSINGLQAKRVVHLPVRFSYENVKQLNRPSHLPYLFSDAYYYLVSGTDVDIFDLCCLGLWRQCVVCGTDAKSYTPMLLCVCVCVWR